MQLSTQDLKIELFSASLHQIAQHYGLQLNGATLSNQQLVLEFQSCIDDEDIVFDVYYDQNLRLEKFHVDEDYERSFHQYFHLDQFSDAHIEFLQSCM